MIEINVDLADRSYPILIGRGAKQELARLVPKDAKKAAIVTQANVGVHVEPGIPARTLVMDDGESAKSIETIEELCRGFAQMELSRSDVVIAVGGGVVTDAAGFAAAVFNRGVALINVSTTLLGQVDAAIGGKTAVNIPEGKNLVGAFWQPLAVICDTETLETLPAGEYRSGTGEMAKYTFLGSRVGMDGSALPTMPLEEQVAFCAELKAKVVAADEREGDLRAILNYGHTLAHALEIVGHFNLRHGEAVSIGVHFAARLARELARIDDSRVKEHVDVLQSYDLPTDLPNGVDVDKVIGLMRRDKKAAANLTFVLDGPNGVETVKNVQEQVVRKVLEEMPR